MIMVYLREAPPKLIKQKTLKNHMLIKSNREIIWRLASWISNLSQIWTNKNHLKEI